MTTDTALNLAAGFLSLLILYGAWDAWVHSTWRKHKVIKWQHTLGFRENRYKQFMSLGVKPSNLLVSRERKLIRKAKIKLFLLMGWWK